MHPIMPMNQQTPNSDALSLSSSEKNDERHAFDFLDQMSQMMEPKDAGSPDPIREKETENSAPAASDTPLIFWDGKAILSGKLIQTRVRPDFNGTDSGSPELEDGVNAGTQTNDIQGAIPIIMVPQLPDDIMAEAMPGSEAPSGDAESDKFQSAANPSVEPPLLVTDSNANDSLTPRLGRDPDGAPRMTSAMLHEAPIPAKSKMEEPAFGFINDLRNMRGPNHSNPQDLLSRAHLQTGFQTATLESSDKSFPLSGSMDTSGQTDLAVGSDLMGSKIAKVEIVKDVQGMFSFLAAPQLHDNTVSESMPKVRSLCGDALNGNCQSTTNPSVEYPPPIKDSNASGSLTPPLEKDPDGAPRMVSGMLEESPIPLRPKIEENTRGFINDLRNMRLSSHAVPQTLSNRDHLQTDFQTATLESSNKSFLPSGSMDTSVKKDLAGGSDLTGNNNTKIEMVKDVDPPFKAQTHVSTSHEGKNPQGAPNGTQVDKMIFQIPLPESSSGSVLQSGVNNSSQRVALTDNLDVSQCNVRPESSSMNDSAGKAQEGTVTTPGGLEFGENGTDPEAPRDMPVSANATQRKPEAPIQNSGKTPSAAAENAQEVLAAPQISGGIRRGNTSHINGSNSEPVPPTQSREFLFQVAQRIQFQILDGKETVRIQLKPENLGRIEISAETTSNGVLARIATESHSVKSYLENTMHVLQQILQDQGLKVDRIHIVYQDGFDLSDSSGHHAQSGHARSGHSGAEYRGSHELSGSPITDLPEEISLDSKAWSALHPNIRFHTVA